MEKIVKTRYNDENQIIVSDGKDNPRLELVPIPLQNLAMEPDIVYGGAGIALELP